MNMLVRRYRFTLPLGLAVLLLAAGASAQQVTLSNARGLDFGRFVANTGGTVVLGPTGLRSRTGGVILLNSPNAGQAMFNVGKFSNGNGNKAVVMSLPANGSTRLTSGANTLTLTGFVSSPASIQTIPAAGMTLGVGATLTVPAKQAPGTYSGSFSVIVNYQ